MPDELADIVYRFGPFQLHNRESLLYRDGELVSLPPKAVDTLRYLLQHRGQLVTKDELRKAVWQGTFVEEGAIGQNIFRLRRALGSHGDPTAYIETIPKRGYRFIEEIEILPAADGAASTTARIPMRFWAVAVAAMALIAAFLVTWTNGQATKVSPAAATPAMRRLTRDGGVRYSAISPDGQKAAYLTADTQGNSLWAMDVASGNRSRLANSIATKYIGLTFSPDGAWIYLVLDNSLHRIRFSGGPLEKIIDGVDEVPSISPDGVAIAFPREDLAKGESAVMVIRGHEEPAKALAVRKLPKYYGPLRWHPDGEVLAVASGSVGEFREMSLVEIPRNGGPERLISGRKWANISAIDWLPSGKALILSASDERWKPTQLWLVTYPEGNASLLREDDLDFQGVSITRQGVLATTARASVTDTFTANLGRTGETSLTPLPNGGRNEQEPVWTTTGRLLYESTTSEGRLEIWSMDADGRNRHMLTRNGCDNHSPAVLPGGDVIAYVCDCSSKSALCTMRGDGQNQTQRWFGKSVNSPSWSPDGHWLFFESNDGGKPVVWKFSLSDGKAEQLTNQLSRMPAVSPDGQRVAMYYWSERPGAPRQLVTVPVWGGEPSRVADLPEDSRVAAIQWTHDSTALLYLLRARGRAEIWRQPLDGGPATPATHFGDDRTAFFDVSPDDSRIVGTRVGGWSDIVLLQLPGLVPALWSFNPPR